jgi:hypothetical protein
MHHPPFRGAGKVKEPPATQSMSVVPLIVNVRGDAKLPQTIPPDAPSTK